LIQADRDDQVLFEVQLEASLSPLLGVSSGGWHPGEKPTK
jgi:hypothetical protein